MRTRFLVISTVVFMFAKSACADQTKLEIDKSTRAATRAALIELLKNSGINEKSQEQAVNKRVNDFSSPVSKLKSDTYSDEFGSWVSSSISMEARGLGLGFLDTNDNSKRATGSIIRHLSNSLNIDSDQAKQLVAKRNLYSSTSLTFDEEIKKEFFKEFDKANSVTLTSLTLQDEELISAINPILRGILDKENLLLDSASSPLIQNYFQLALIRQFKAAESGIWFSLSSIASPIYDPKEKSYLHPMASFPEVISDFKKSLGEVITRQKQTVTVRMDGLRSFIWDAYQSRWTKTFRSYSGIKRDKSITFRRNGISEKQFFKENLISINYTLKTPSQ